MLLVHSFIQIVTGEFDLEGHAQIVNVGQQHAILYELYLERKMVLALQRERKSKRRRIKDYHDAVEDICIFSERADGIILVVSKDGFAVTVVEDAAALKPDVREVWVARLFESPLSYNARSSFEKDDIICMDFCHRLCSIRLLDLVFANVA